MSTILLSDLAFILPGYPFRGAITPKEDGSARVVQMRDLDITGDIRWEGLVRTQLTSRKKPDWIATGDILFVARGQRFFAVYVDEAPYEAVPANQLIHLRLKPGFASQVLAAFVAWQINQAPAQQHLASLVTGTHLPTISKSALAKLPISLPGSIKEQEVIVTLDSLIKKETQEYEQLMRNRRDLMDVIAERIVNQGNDLA